MKGTNPIKKYGKVNFEFNLFSESNYIYVTSNLVAEAIDPRSGLPFPARYVWYRVRGKQVQ